MAFNINAHVILQGPKNIQKVTNTIKQQLSGISVPVNLQVSRGANTQLGKINNQLNALSKTARTTQTSLSKLNAISASVGTGLGKSAGASSKLNSNLGGVAVNANKAAGAMATLGKETALTFKRFAAAGIVTATVFRLGAAISEATGNALEFERELVKLQQVTGQNAKQLDGLKNAVRDVSKGLGISANELVGIARLFAQTGQNLREVEASMKAIARSTLAPTFGDMAQTAEGLIAALAQFKIAASSSEAVLGSLNRVSKKFAVESQDLIAAIRRAGGVFALSAGQFKEPIEALNEFSAIFTAVRSTTRESAETIATGLRTIFTRIQRRGTIDMLKGLGINLLDAQGKFKGLFESFRILSKELDTIIQKGDAVTLSAIAEELGGTRQIGKLLPAIREFRKAESALVEAQKGAVEGLGGDVQKGLTPLIKQFEQLGARFEDFIRTIADSRTFKQLSQFALDTANAFLTLGEALAPLLPLFTQLAAAKLARGAFAFGQGFLGSTKGLGAGGLGSRVGGLVAGSPQGSSPAVTQQTQGNTSALLKNTTALTNLTKGLGGLKGITTALSGLDSSIDLLNSRMSDLSRNVNNLATRSFGGGFGTSGGGSRRRRGFSSGGRVPFASGGRVPFAKPLSRVPRKAPTSPRGTQTFGSSQFGTSSTGYTLGASDTVRKETGLNLTGQETVTIKPGVSPKRRRATTFGVVSLRPKDVEDALYADITWSQAGLQGSGKGLRKSLGSRKTKRSGRSEVNKDQMTLQVLGDSLDANIENNFEDQIETAMRTSVTDVSKAIRKKIGIVDKKGFSATDVKQAGVNFENISGNLFEHMLNTVGHPYSPDKVNANDAFDFPAGIGANLGSVFPTFPSLKSIPTDAKRTLNKDAMRSLIKKSLNTLKKGMAGGARFSSKGSRGKFAMQAAQGLQRTMARDPQYWTDDGLLKSILMPGELVASGVPASQANRIASGSLDAVMGLNPSNVAVVPGTGDRDTFPMDLAPGTVVVPKGLSQEAMADGLDPRVPLASGGRVPFKKAGRVPFAGNGVSSGTQRRSQNFELKNATRLNSNFGILADAAVGLAFSMSMIDFSTIESSLISISQLAFVIPSAVASFKVLPGLFKSLQAGVQRQIRATRLTTRGGVQAGVVGPSGKFRSSAARASRGLALKGGVTTAGATIIATFVGKAISDSLTKRTQMEGVEGVSRLRGGDAELAVGVQGAAAAFGALASSVLLVKLGFSKMNAGLLGLSTAFVVGAQLLDDYRINLLKNAEFVAFEEFGEGISKATKTLEEFNNAAFVTVKGINKVTTDVGSALSDFENVSQAAFERAFAEESASTGIGAMIGGVIGGFATGGVGAAGGAALGEVAERNLFQGGPGDRAAAALKSAERVLGAVSEKMIEAMNVAFEKITDDFINTIGLSNNTLQKLVAIKVPLSDTGTTASEAAQTFDLLKKTLGETGEQGQALSKFLDTKLKAGMIESIKGASDGVKRLFTAASAKGIDFTNINELNQNLQGLASAAGVSATEMALNIKALETFKQRQQESIIATINQKAAQEELDRMLNQVTKSLKLFITGLELMATMMEQGNNRFSAFSTEVADFSSYMIGGGGRIMQPGRSAVNPFSNIETSTEEAINAGINRISVATGASTEGLRDTLKLRKVLPDLAKAVGERSGTTQIQTGAQLTEILRDTLKKDFDIDFNNLPEAVQAGVEKGLTAQIKGREGISVNQLVKDEGFEAILKQFGEGSEEVRAALEKSFKALTEAQKTLIDVVNQYIAVEKFRIDQSVRANAIIENTAKSLDRFRSGSNLFEKANNRLLGRLNAIDRGRGNVTLNPADQVAAVERARSEARKNRQALAAIGGPAIGADMTADEIRKSLESTGSIFSSGALALVDALAENEKALMRETKKLDELINETEILEATTQTLSDVQKAQMDAEAQARFFINQLARVEGEADPIKRGQMLAEIMMPFTAFDKALAGGTLSMREFASLVGNFDARIAPMLRSLGVSEEEIAGAKRNFFARFSKVFPDIFTSAVSQSFVRITGNLDGVLANIAQSMETAGKRFEDIEGVDFPALMADAMNQFGLTMNNSVGDIMDAMDEFSENKANALLENTENIAKPIEDAISKELTFLGQGKLAEKLRSIEEPADRAKAAVELFGDEIVPDLNTELGNLIRIFNEAGAKFNSLSQESKDIAKSNMEVKGDIIQTQQYRDTVMSPGEISQRVSAMAGPGATRKQQSELRRLGTRLGVDAETLEGPLKDLANEIITILFGEVGGGLTDWREYFGEVSGGMDRASIERILSDSRFGSIGSVDRMIEELGGMENIAMRAPYLQDAANRAGLSLEEYFDKLRELEGRPGDEAFRDFIRPEAVDAKLRRVDVRKRDQALDAVGQARREELMGLSPDELVQRSLKELPNESFIAELRKLADLPETINRATIESLRPEILATALANVSQNRFSQDGSFKNINQLYKELRRLGKDEEAEALLIDLSTLDQAALDTAANTAEIADILRDRENPTETAQMGGIIGGRSHAQGGTLIEAEAGEFIIKKSSVASIGASNLSYINNNGKFPMARNGGSVSIGSMGDLANAASTMDFAGLTELLNAMNEFSGGNGMDAIANSNAMIGQGGIIQNMMTRMQQGSMGGGPQGPQSVRQQLDAVFQKRLGNLTGGIGTLKGQVLNNALKEFSGLVIKEGSVEGAEKRTGGKRSIDKISRILRDFGMTSNKIESSIDIFKSLLGDEKDNLSQEKQMLAQMGIVQKQGSPEASALAKQLKDQFKKLQEGQSKLIDSSEKIQENTDPNSASCVCIDKLIAFLAGFPVDIAKAVISPSQVVGGGGGAGGAEAGAGGAEAGVGGAGAGRGTQGLGTLGAIGDAIGGAISDTVGNIVDGVMGSASMISDIKSGLEGALESATSAIGDFFSGGAGVGGDTQGLGTLDAIGDAIGGAISGTVGNIADGVMGSASMISDIKSGLEGALESITSGIGDFFSGGGAQGFQNIEPGKVRKNAPNASGTIGAFGNLAEYFKGSIEQFAEGVIKGAELAAYSMKFYADAIAKGGTMTQEEFEKYRDSLRTQEERDLAAVVKARMGALRGPSNEVTNFDEIVSNLTPTQAAMFAERERTTGSGQGQFVEKARNDTLTKLEEQAAKFMPGGQFGRPAETSTTYYPGFKDRFDDPDTFVKEVDPEKQAHFDAHDAKMEKRYNERKAAAEQGAKPAIRLPSGRAAEAIERFKNRNRAADIDKAAASPPAAKAGPLEEIEMNKVDPEEKMTVQLINGLCSCFAAIFKPMVVGIKGVEDAVIDKAFPPLEKGTMEPLPPLEKGRGGGIQIDTLPLPGTSTEEFFKKNPVPAKKPESLDKMPDVRGVDEFDSVKEVTTEGVANIIDVISAGALQGIQQAADTTAAGAGFLSELMQLPLQYLSGSFTSGLEKMPDVKGVSPDEWNEAKKSYPDLGDLKDLEKMPDVRGVSPDEWNEAKKSYPDLGDLEDLDPRPPAQTDPYPPNFSPDDNYEEDFDWGGEGVSPPPPPMKALPPLDKGPGSTLPDTIEKGNAEIAQAIAGICGCFAISVGDLAIGDEVADQANNIQDSILGSIGNALLNAAKTVGSDLIEKGKSFVDFITDKDAIKSTIEENRAGLSAVGNVDAAKTGIDNIFGFIDGIKAVVNNIQKGQPYEGLGGRPYVATPMRDQEGNMTGFSPVPQRSAAGPGRGPLYLGVGRAGQERYDTMTSNRDKFAAQLEDPKFAEQAAKNPKGYAARILAQKEALDANIKELEEQYGFGPGGQDAANPAEKAAQEKAKQEAGQMPAKQQGNLAAGVKAAESMGFIWDPSDKDATIGDLISFLQSTCLSVQFCDKAAGSTTPEAPGPDPYPPNFSPDDNYEEDFDWGGEGVSPPSMRVQDLFPPGGNLDREVTPPKFLGGQSAIGTPFGGNAGDEASGNVENIISKLEGIGPLISDETVTRLESFTNNFGTFTDSVVSRMENVTSQIQSLLGQTLQVQLTTNRIDVVINAGNVLNKVQAVVQEEILNSVGQEIQTMKEQIRNLAGQNNPLGSPDTSSSLGNGNNLG